jgi:hypothetical protein
LLLCFGLLWLSSAHTMWVLYCGKKGSHYTKVIVSAQGNQSEFTQVAPI